MFASLQKTARFLQYYLSAANSKGHGVHSPFVFDFILNVLNDDRIFYAYPTLEALRKRMFNNKSDFFYDQSINSPHSQQIKDPSFQKGMLFSRSAVKYDQMLFRMAAYYGASNMLVVHTASAITPLYLALANPAGCVSVIEKEASQTAITSKLLQACNITNLGIQVSHTTDTLPVPQLKGQVDLAIIGSKWKGMDPLSYIKQLIPNLHANSILVVDHIHEGPHQSKIWAELQAAEGVTLTIDLFRMGLVFFRKEQKVKQHFTIRF